MRIIHFAIITLGVAMAIYFAGVAEIARALDYQECGGVYCAPADPPARR
jgi:hypothetical protein